MRDWLREAISAAGTDVAEAYLFGSMLDPAREPRDADIVVVTADGAGRPAWRRVRLWREQVVGPFHARFNLPLSVIVATPSEWRELDGTLIRKRERLV